MTYLLEGQTSPRLRFRKLKLEDQPHWMEFCRHPESNKYWKTTDPQTPEVRCRMLFDSTFSRYHKNMGGLNALEDKLTGAFVGLCGLLKQQVDRHEELEVGYAIMPQHWNKGYATEAARKCIVHAFENKLTDSIISIIHVDNIESEKVALKNDMRFEKRTVYKGNPVNIFRLQSVSLEKLKNLIKPC